MSFRRDEIIFLLGAGASVDAKIPASYQMIEEIEKKVEADEKWKKYRDLYFFIKSAILFSEGIKGNKDPQYNIEILLITLEELLKRDSHPLFPFIGSWVPKLPEVAKEGFCLVSDLKNQIVISVRDWIIPRHDDVFQYYRGLFRFQRSLEFPLRIFTLNYDLAIETTAKNFEGERPRVERGFNPENRKWEWKLLADEVSDNINIFLYKLHGSIDWLRSDDGSLDECANLTIDEKSEIIFGTAYKMQYADPFLFFAYEFRKRTLDDAKLIFCVGYSFSDDHINKILQQAIQADPSRRIISVNPFNSEVNERKRIICSKLKIKIEETAYEQIVPLNQTAKSFFEKLDINFAKQYKKQDDSDVPFN